MKIFDKTFKLTLASVFLAEILSFVGFLHPAAGRFFFLMILLITLAASIYKLEYGLLAVLTELFISSKGYLFSLSLGHFNLSIRIAMWLVVMLVWGVRFLSRLIREKRLSFGFDFSYFLPLFFFLGLGGLIGLLKGNGPADAFFDYNNWFYFGLLLPLSEVFHENNFRKIFSVFSASIVWLAFETFSSLYLFSHNLFMRPVYKWIRNTGVGEITQMPNGFSRIFFQSHFFALAAFFIFFLLFAGARLKKERSWPYFLVLTASLASVLISFSRSFWVGLAGGVGLLLALAAGLIRKKKISWKDTLSFAGAGLISLALSFAIMAAIVKFPFPRTGADLSDDLTNRLSNFSGEAAVSSRWSLLPELWKGIKKDPLLGHGFGTTVTYKSSDPRVLELHPDGLYTTYAFEWGWLDLWLKIGLLGVLAYLYLLFILSRRLWRRFSAGSDLLSAGFLLGILVMVLVNIFTPYLNHPLGIGYLLLAAVLAASPLQVRTDPHQSGRA